MKNIIFITIMTFSLTALAEKPYGIGGCGFGSQLMGKEGNQVLAITTNNTGTQTFGISSGTSNCVTATEQTARIRNFIEANYSSLITDMAKGQGDSVKILSSFYGCDSNAFADAMKSNYESITPNTESAIHVMANINTVIEDSEPLRTKCTNAI